MQIRYVVEQSGRVPVYGTTLHAPKLQLAVELTDAGREMAVPLYQIERDTETGRYLCRRYRRKPFCRCAS
ncbi:hypothetical protein FMJ33_23885 [Klebsiella grimontii]|nr:hypothetical protein [Klebsiella grimontii]